MPAGSSPVWTFAFAVVMLGWLLFAGIFVIRRHAPLAETRRADRTALAGILLQGSGYAVVWAARRPPFTPPAGVAPPFDVALVLLVVALVAGSLWMIRGARRALGRQWSIQARIVTEHALVTDGPYRLVRHPIYSGMLGMLVATGLAASRWTALLGGIVLFGAGAWIRIRAEERLLREAFGPAYEAYARDVPALIPRPGSRGGRRSG
jgi:protein-S-isoprenylcysteine O-methyltransferase Ste14